MHVLDFLKKFSFVELLTMIWMQGKVVHSVVPEVAEKRGWDPAQD